MRSTAVLRFASLSQMLPTSQTWEKSSPNTGDESVEFDALPVDVFRAQVVAEVEKRLDLDALARQVGRELGNLPTGTRVVG